jgi:aminocarboxymuconate-semialdehyde decarboxylase
MPEPINPSRPKAVLTTEVWPPEYRKRLLTLRRCELTPNIDLHCHFIPLATIDLIETEGAVHSVRLANHGTVSFAGHKTTQPFPAGMLDLDEREAWMDARESAFRFFPRGWTFLPMSSIRMTAPGSRALNELTMGAIEPRSDWFRAMAAVPLQSPELAAQELRYAIEVLEMAAVEIGTSVAGTEVDDPSLAVFWREAERLDCLVLIHPPYQSIGFDRLSRYFLDNIVSNPAESTVAAAHLIFGGVLERHPRLEVCLTHGGGFIPYQIGRQDRGFEAIPARTAGCLHAAPSSFLQRFCYDTIVHSAAALRFLGRAGR